MKAHQPSERAHLFDAELDFTTDSYFTCWLKKPSGSSRFLEACSCCSWLSEFNPLKVRLAFRLGSENTDGALVWGACEAAGQVRSAKNNPPRWTYYLVSYGSWESLRYYENTQKAFVYYHVRPKSIKRQRLLGAQVVLQASAAGRGLQVHHQPA